MGWKGCVVACSAVLLAEKCHLLGCKAWAVVGMFKSILFLLFHGLVLFCPDLGLFSCLWGASHTGDASQGALTLTVFCQRVILESPFPTLPVSLLLPTPLLCFMNRLFHEETKASIWIVVSSLFVRLVFRKDSHTRETSKGVPP